MKLYHHPLSSNCRKVSVAALLLGIDLDLQFIDLPAGAQKKPDYLRLNPNGLAPTLEDGSFVLWESNAIMQYLAEKKPGNTLWPSDPRMRADISRWQCWELAHWTPALAIIIHENLVKKLLKMGEPDPAEIKKGEEATHRFAQILDNHLQGKKYLVGEALTLADISVAAILMYRQPARLPLDQYKNINGWVAQIEKLDAWQKTAPPPMG